VPGNTGTMPRIFLLGLLLLLVPATAHAADEPPKAEPGDDSAAHLTALELMVRPTLGGAGSSSLVTIPPGIAGNNSRIFDGSASPYGASFGVGAEIGFRFHPLVSAGLRGDLSKVSASAPSDGTTDLSRSRQSAGLYLRAYPLALTPSVRKHIDPWFATGALYMHDTQTFTLPAATTAGTSVPASWKLEHHGVGIPLAIGIDYRITKALSIGPSFEYTILVPIAGCASRSALGQVSENCSGGSSVASKTIVAESTGAWTAGLDLRFTPF
jgi:opacity protein-like surface antigen